MNYVPTLSSVHNSQSIIHIFLLMRRVDRQARSMYTAASIHSAI